jgi:phosphatidylglycerophosphate synthase
MSHDTLIHRIVRPAVRRLAPTGVTPNQVTTLRLVTGVAAAVAFAQGGDMWPHIGGAIFILSMLLDRADGELARQTGQSSPSGHRYDLICDCTANVIAFLGIGIGLSEGGLGRSAILLGILAGFGITVLFWQLNVLKLCRVVPYTLWDRRVVVDPDDTIIFVPILIWCGWAEPMLVAAAVVTPAIALWLWVSAIRSKNNPKDDAARP